MPGLPKEKQVSAKNAFFALAYFHSLVAERKKFGATGWNIPYEFDDPDFEISFDQVFALLRDGGDSPPFKLMRYFVGEINYAGRLLTKEDEEMLLAILDDLVNNEVVFTAELGGGGGFLPRDIKRGHYGIPRLNMGEGYYKFVRSMPLFDEERIFGFEPNVERVRLSKVSRELFGGMRGLRQEESGLEVNPLDITVRDRSDNLVQQKARELLDFVPLPLEYEDIQQRFPTTAHNPLVNLGNKEAEKYSILLRTVRTSVDDVMNDRMSAASEETWKGILHDRVPRRWLQFAYPVGESSLSHFLANLKERFAFVLRWGEQGSAMRSFWLPGFY